MKLAQTRRTARTGFTLIELMVVIAIIATLVALLVPAVVKVLGLGSVARNKTEIGNVEAAVVAFHGPGGFKLGKEFFPSRLVLCENYADYGNPPNASMTQLYADSLAFLQRMFPRLWRTAAAQAQTVDWDANGAYSPPVVLEGDQCLVFFLGGIPAPPGQLFACTGFSSVGSNPAQPGGSSRIGPFFDFESSRLVQIHGNAFYSYLDTYGQKPYAYFSSYTSPNGYNRYFGTLGISDCSTLGVWPYAEFVSATQPPRYLYPNKFQIISAGSDAKFGAGTDFSGAQNAAQTWTSTNANVFAPNGTDDQANFYGDLLGLSE
jgi:prepilin-type N-terminal cleavage/methylation domain-containing protein